MGKEKRLAFHHSRYTGPTKRMRQTISPLAVAECRYVQHGEIAAQLKRYQPSIYNYIERWRMSTPEWIGLISAVLTILSVTLNVYQWKRKKDMEDMYHSNLFALYNHMHRIAEIAGRCRIIMEQDDSENDTETLSKVIRYVEQCTGIADSVRTEVLAFSERYMHRPIWRQHPGSPDEQLIDDSHKRPEFQ